MHLLFSFSQSLLLSSLATSNHVTGEVINFHSHGLNKAALPLFDCIAPPDPVRRIDKLCTLYLPHLYTLQLRWLG
jgi:hypothetical protein